MNGSIALYRANDGLVGLDGCLPLSAGGDFFFAIDAAPGPARPYEPRPYRCAVNIVGRNAELVQMDPSAWCSLQAEVLRESLPALLTKAGELGISVRDDEGVCD